MSAENHLDGHFDYNRAFDRNIGWLTEWEQQILRAKRIAISGLGGVGGIHLITMARLGVQNFNISDPDSFELINFNRQIGAYVSTLGKPKAEIFAQFARDINPDADIRIIPGGITEENLDEFLKDADLYIDGLDFYVLKIRQKIFRRCHELGIPAVTAAPLGTGVAYLTFLPGHMSFDEYFGFKDGDHDQNQIKFLAGLNPLAGQRAYLVDPSRFNLKENRGPSTIMACNLCAGVAGTIALKILLNRKGILAAPWYLSFDPFLNKFSKGYLRGGSQNWLIGLCVRIISAVLLKGKKISVPSIKVDHPDNDLEKILECAKWTPSGDNSQPWYFDIKSDFEVDFHMENEGSIYDYAGIPSVMTVGFFVETFRIAASNYGYETQWSFDQSSPSHHIARLKIIKSNGLPKDGLFPFIKIRSTVRYPYTIRPLTEKDKKALESSVGDEFKIRWFESFSDRMTMTEISSLGTFIRFSIPEGFKTHSHIVDYENKFSVDKIPIEAIGVTYPTQWLMKFQLKNWGRMNFMNRFMATAILAQFEISYLPGLFCAAHYLITWKNPKEKYSPADLVRAGQATQKFWLTATKLGLAMQPNIAPVALSYYHKHNIAFTSDKSIIRKTDKLKKSIELFAPVDDIVFMGRVGFPFSTLMTTRSVRKSLTELITKR